MSIKSTFTDVKLSDGNVVPGIGFGVGTAWYGRKGVDRELVEAVKLALKVGYRHLDCAEMYANEESVGVALKEAAIPRQDLFITSKVGGGIKDIRGTLQNSLKLLGTGYVDLYLIHVPTKLGTEGFPTHKEAWKVMCDLKDEGLARSIGVSNYRISDLEKTMDGAKHPITCNQIEFHPFVYSKLAPLVEFSRKHDIKIEAYGPTTPITQFSGTSFDKVLDKITKAVSERAGQTVEPHQVLLQLAASRGAIVVTTSGKEHRMKEQLQAGALKLTEEEGRELADAAPEHKRRFMPHMDEN